MKISINSNLVEGAWGGGNNAIKSIYKNLITKGIEVTTKLKSNDIDLILMSHPNKKLHQSCSYGIDDIIDYINLHPNTLLAHRVNTSGEFHRGTGNETDEILGANKYADFSIFISKYLRELYISRGFDITRPHCVILNGADEDIFFPLNESGRYISYDQMKKLHIVTHHWSGNYMKGFDIYERLDQLLETEPFHNLFNFTIIGNVPKGLHFRRTQVLTPLQGTTLAEVLRQQDLYLTASRNEGAGMHHIEGMRSGLPVLYLKSGALPEYCSPYGIGFTLIDFEQKLLEMKEKHSILREKVLECPYTATRMSLEYINLFERMIFKRRNNPLPEPNLKIILKQCLLIPLKKKLFNVYELAKIGFTKILGTL